MDKIVDHLFVFRGEGEVEKFPGNYSDFRSYEDSAIPEKKTEVKKEKNSWKQKNNENNLTFNEQKEFKNLENDISKLEEKKTNLENSFATEEYTPTQIENVSKKIGEFSAEIEEKEFRWLELSTKLEG